MNLQLLFFIVLSITSTASESAYSSKASSEWQGYEEVQRQLNNTQSDANNLTVNLGVSSRSGIFNILGNILNDNKQSSAISPKILSIEEVRSYTQFAGAAYCKNIQQWSCYPYCTSFRPGEIKVIHVIRSDQYDIDGYIAYKGQNELIVAIRGSKSLNNWIVDGLLFQTTIELPPPYNQAKVHFGFNKASLAVLSQIGEVLKREVNVNPKVKITLLGHSLGGSIMGMLSHYLVQYKYITFDQFQLITFGMPRVGDATYAKYINSNVKTLARITHQTDFIPLIPPIALNYLHFNNEINVQGIGNDAKAKLCLNAAGEDPTCIINPLQLRSWPAHFQYWDVTFDQCQ
ncbi:alpha/beta-hydrolase [Neoconidiobolus thromboides FSU 785]|nr:alpha/beta-hydrolase [Neoconidiobolus thromboides FSU 785]